MYGAFNVWLDVHPEQEESEAPQRAAYAAADVHLGLSMQDAGSAEDAAEEVVTQVLIATPHTHAGICSVRLQLRLTASALRRHCVLLAV